MNLFKKMLTTPSSIGVVMELTIEKVFFFVSTLVTELMVATTMI